jgi:hypothetical protein
MTTVSQPNSIWNTNATWTPPVTSGLADVLAGQKQQTTSFSNQLAAYTNQQNGSATPHAHAHHRHADSANVTETPASQAQQL